MHPTKASGFDGMPTFFFENILADVSNEVMSYVLNILYNGTPIEHINRTHIVLILMKKNM